ncbi:asparaginase domain-containing protein [Rothia sp. CCM 9417]|uniref:asparaginase domain-containing protein n=1 Tax=unclassified Rothia (in: high G+C Gram-positive bacteria) TaxID=2689056 RepID=UPI003AC88A8D
MPIQHPSHITVLTTGGTVDKIYSLEGELIIGPPSVPELLGPVLSDINFTVQSVLKLDSLDMTDRDRAVLASALEAVETQHVMITHGTDTMPETARYLQANKKAQGKVVVLTGAMQPASMRASDASFNLGSAVTALGLLEPGIYIAMSGRIFPATTVLKDKARGIFTQGN